MAVYAMSDLHGSLDLLRQIQSFLQKDDTVYVLGDCGDRGCEPLETIKEVMRDKRFIYLKGNHEEMLVDALCEFEIQDYYGRCCDLLFYNGGYETFLQLCDDIHKNSLVKMINKLPLLATYTNKDNKHIVLSHAGFTPNISTLTKDTLIWNRKHFRDEPIDYSDIIIVHGHTPKQYICKELGLEVPIGALWYANNKKVCIDCMTYRTNKIVLLNLDTFEEHIFKIGDDNAYRMV